MEGKDVKGRILSSPTAWRPGTEASGRKSRQRGTTPLAVVFLGIPVSDTQCPEGPALFRRKQFCPNPMVWMTEPLQAPSTMTMILQLNHSQSQYTVVSSSHRQSTWCTKSLLTLVLKMLADSATNGFGGPKEIVHKYTTTQSCPYSSRVLVRGTLSQRTCPQYVEHMVHSSGE